MDKFAKGREVLNVINDVPHASARFVGGCVRDFILGRNFTDIDIATTLTPDKTTEAFESKGIRVIPTGIDFGTVTIVHEKKNYEITTLRSDISCDGRHAKVSYSTDYKEDAKRRDFTFNALYMDVNDDIYDFFEGQKDLKNGVVRFIGKAEERIKEDYLRILRLFRFHAYYGSGEILPNQIDACKTLSDGLDNISGERIRAEMIKLLSTSQCFNAVSEMVNCGVLSKITTLKNKDFKLDALKTATEFYTLLQEGNIKPNPMMMLSALLDSDIGDAGFEGIFERWKLTNKEKTLLERLSESLKVDFKDDYSIRKTARMSGEDEFIDYMVLNYAKGRLSKAEAEKLINWVVDFSAPEFPLKSADLFSLGMKPNKQFGQILRDAEELWERSNYQLSKEEILKGIKV